MAERIKGITAVIGGDSTGVKKSFKSVDDTISSRTGEILYSCVKERKLEFPQLAVAIKDSNGRVSETFENMEDPIDKMQVSHNNLKLAGALLSDCLNTVLGPVFEAADKAYKVLQDGF